MRFARAPSRAVPTHMFLAVATLVCLLSRNLAIAQSPNGLTAGIANNQLGRPALDGDSQPSHSSSPGTESYDNQFDKAQPNLLTGSLPSPPSAVEDAPDDNRFLPASNNYEADESPAPSTVISQALEPTSEPLDNREPVSEPSGVNSPASLEESADTELENKLTPVDKQEPEEEPTAETPSPEQSPEAKPTAETPSPEELSKTTTDPLEDGSSSSSSSPTADASTSSDKGSKTKEDTATSKTTAARLRTKTVVISRQVTMYPKTGKPDPAHPFKPIVGAPRHVSPGGEFDRPLNADLEEDVPKANNKRKRFLRKSDGEEKKIEKLESIAKDKITWRDKHDDPSGAETIISVSCEDEAKCTNQATSSSSTFTTVTLVCEGDGPCPRPAVPSTPTPVCEGDGPCHQPAVPSTTLTSVCEGPGPCPQPSVQSTTSTSVCEITGTPSRLPPESSSISLPSTPSKQSSGSVLPNSEKTSSSFSQPQPVHTTIWETSQSAVHSTVSNTSVCELCDVTKTPSKSPKTPIESFPPGTKKPHSSTDGKCSSYSEVVPTDDGGSGLFSSPHLKEAPTGTADLTSLSTPPPPSLATGSATHARVPALMLPVPTILLVFAVMMVA